MKKENLLIIISTDNVETILKFHYFMVECQYHETIGKEYILCFGVLHKSCKYQ